MRPDVLAAHLADTVKALLVPRDQALREDQQAIADLRAQVAALAEKAALWDATQDALLTATAALREQLAQAEARVRELEREAALEPTR